MLGLRSHASCCSSVFSDWLVGVWPASRSRRQPRLRPESGVAQLATRVGARPTRPPPTAVVAADTVRFWPLALCWSQGDDPLAASGVLLQRNTGDGTMVNVNFLWGWENQAGTKGWGYRHIKYEHGWSVDDRADTTIALEAVPFSYDPSDPTSRRFYIGPEYTGANATPCWRVVVVAPQAVAEGPKGNQVMESKPKGIITSYGATDPPEPPA